MALQGHQHATNYAMWSTATDAVQLPIYDIFGFLSSPSTPAGVTGAPFNVIEYSNTILIGFLPSRNVYKNGANVYNDLNLLQLPVTNNTR
jgi:hypothetical protein